MVSTAVCVGVGTLAAEGVAVGEGIAGDIRDGASAGPTVTDLVTLGTGVARLGVLVGLGLAVFTVTGAVTVATVAAVGVALGDGTLCALGVGVVATARADAADVETAPLELPRSTSVLTTRAYAVSRRCHPF